MFILPGSSVSMMQEAFSNAAAPLFGRRTASLALRPLAMDYLAEYLDWNLEVKDHRWQTFYLYALLGGVPCPRLWNSKKGISLKPLCGSSLKNPSCGRSSIGSSGRNLWPGAFSRLLWWPSQENPCGRRPCGRPPVFPAYLLIFPSFSASVWLSRTWSSRKGSLRRKSSSGASQIPSSVSWEDSEVSLRSLPGESPRWSGRALKGDFRTNTWAAL